MGPPGWGPLVGVAPLQAEEDTGELLFARSHPAKVCGCQEETSPYALGAGLGPPDLESTH